MDWSNVITGGFSLIVAVVTYFAAKGTNQAQSKKISYEADGVLADKYDRLLLKLEQKLDKLEVENEVLNTKEFQNSKKILTLEHDIDKLINKIMLLESAHMDLPIPMWLKDTKGVMLALNIEYENTFLTPNGFTTQDYIGKNDLDIWGEKIGKPFMKNDKHVFRTGRMLDSTEIVEINGKLIEYRVIKYVRYSGNIKIGIAGIAIPKKET